jgi:hypothetical protein
VKHEAEFNRFASARSYVTQHNKKAARLGGFLSALADSGARKWLA